MKCSKIKNKIAASLNLDKVETAHVQSCQSCQRFAADVEQFVFVDFQTPGWIKMRARSKIYSALNEAAPSSQSIGQRIIQLWRSPKLVLALTVIFAAALAGGFIWQFYCDQTIQLCRTMTLFLFFVLLQNITTALFIPIFFARKTID